MDKDMLDVLAGLVQHNTYEYFDGPLIYSSKSEDGSLFFYSFYADFENGVSKYVHVPITAEQLAELESGKISVWALVKGKMGYSEYNHLESETVKFIHEPVNDDELPLDDLIINFTKEA